MDISGYLKYYRKKNNFTQEYVAKKLNISRQAISAWENNLACPDLESLLSLSRLYKVSLDDLIGNNIDTPNDNISHGINSLANNIKNLEIIITRLKELL